MVLSVLSNGVSGRYNFVLLLSVYSLYTIPSDTVVIQMSQGMTIEVRKTNIVPRKRNTSLVQTDQMEGDARKSNPKPGSVNEDRDDTHMDEVKNEAFFKEAGAGRRRKDAADDDMDGDCECASSIVYSFVLLEISLTLTLTLTLTLILTRTPSNLSICQICRVFVVKLSL